MSNLSRRIEKLEACVDRDETHNVCGFEVSQSELAEIMRAIDGTSTRPASERPRE